MRLKASVKQWGTCAVDCTRNARTPEIRYFKWQLRRFGFVEFSEQSATAEMGPYCKFVRQYDLSLHRPSLHAKDTPRGGLRRLRPARSPEVPRTRLTSTERSQPAGHFGLLVSGDSDDVVALLQRVTSR